MCVDDLLNNRETKSGSFAVFSTGGIDFVEAVPDFVETFFRNSGSVIFNRDENFSVLYSGFYLDRRIIIAEFNSIIQKIIKNLLDLFHIRFDIELMAGEKQLQADLAV